MVKYLKCYLFGDILFMLLAVGDDTEFYFSQTNSHIAE